MMGPVPETIILCIDCAVNGTDAQATAGSTCPFCGGTLHAYDRRTADDASE